VLSVVRCRAVKKIEWVTYMTANAEELLALVYIED
jgi:hypothetical protein